MKNKKYLLQLCVLMLLCPVFLFNCAELYFASLDCSDEDGESSSFCQHLGDTNLLVKHPMDILFVLNNSEEMQGLNNKVSNNLKQFLRCMEPVDWRVGFISTVNNDATYVGELMPLEMNGQLSIKRFIRQDMDDYEDLFNQSVSLSSGCHLPPYCGDESVTTMDAIQAFMNNPINQELFLREKTPLTTVVISSMEDSGESTADSTLSAVRTIHPSYANNFMNLIVTVPGTTDDCVETVGDSLSNGMDKVSGAATIVGLATGNPLLIVGAGFFDMVSSLFFSNDKIKKDLKKIEMIRLTTLTGGRVLNVCHPNFGEAIAFSIMERIEMEESISEDCKNFDPAHKKLKTLDPNLEI